MKPGDRLESRTVGPVERRDFVRWVGALDDVDSPIHYDDDFARAQGHPSVFAPGMLQASMLADYAIAMFGADNVRRCRMRFVDVVWPGDVLTCSGEIEAERDTGDGREIDVELRCLRPGDQLVVRGWMTFAVPGAA